MRANRIGSRRGISRLAMAVVVVSGAAGPLGLGAQGQAPRVADDSVPHDSIIVDPPRDSAQVDRTFFTKRDAIYSGIALGVSVGIMPFDVRISNWTQEPGIQGGPTLHNAVNSLTHINETPLTIAAVATYGAGRLFHSTGVADVGLHWTEAVVLTDVICEAIRSPLGRARPRVSQNSQYDFNFLKGFTVFADRSFPSIHSAVAFATAASLTQEIHDRHPDAVWYAAPLLYAAAAVPPLTRLYLDQHWMSDVVAGGFVGTLIGSKIVSYAHSHRRSKLDQMLLGVSAVPDGRGDVLISTSIWR